MNYRRGFQRVYAVLTVAWIGVLLLALPADRVKFWQKQQGEASLADVDLGKSGIAITAPPSTLTDADIAARDKSPTENAPPPLPKGAVPLPPGFTPVPADSFVPDEPAAVESRTQKFLWLASVLFGPPLAGYAAIFMVIPWIFRGFRAGTPSAP